MELQEAIQKRKTSNNAFLNKPVLESDLRQIINAANRAPSHFNSQPWDFIVITDENKRREIGQIAKDSMKKLMEQGTFFERYKKYFRFSKQDIETKRTGIHIDRIPFFLRPFISFLFSQKAVSVLNFFHVPDILAKDAENIVTNSPVLLGFMLKKEEYKPGEKSGIYSLISMGAALQNIWLTATSLQMGVQFVSTPMEIPENWNKILEILKVPDTHELMAVYRLGYLDPAVTRNNIDWISDERRSFEELVSWNYYGGKKLS
ncbi:MAG: nitroreductase family protein [Leptospiraceae bacterium]|nr:nitroreductase family protein [Leptospiraceae bacterium]